MLACNTYTLRCDCRALSGRNYLMGPDARRPSRRRLARLGALGQGPQYSLPLGASNPVGSDSVLDEIGYSWQNFLPASLGGGLTSSQINAINAQNAAGVVQASGQTVDYSDALAQSEADTTAVLASAGMNPAGSDSTLPDWLLPAGIAAAVLVAFLAVRR